MAQKGNLQIPFVLRPVGFLGEGQNRYVASVERYSTIGYNEIVAYAARAAHVPETDITMAMDALFDALSYFVCNGHGVKLPNLGVFTFGINAKAEVSEAAAGADAVYRTKVNFVPTRELRDVLDNVAISTLPLNPNGLSEGVASTAKILGVSLKNGKSSTQLQLFGMYNVNRSSVITVRMSGPTESIPMLKIETADGVFSMAGKMIGSNVIYDLANILPNDDYKALSYLQVYEAETNKAFYTMYFSTSTDVAKEFGVTFLGNELMALPYGRPDDYGQVVVNPIDDRRRLLTLRGVNMNRYNQQLSELTLEFDDVEVENIEVAYSSITQFAIVVPNTVRKVHFSGVMVEFTYIIAEAAEGGKVPVVTSLSANGVSVNNGGTSTVEVGKTYNFTLRGLNLDKLVTSPSSFGTDIISAGAGIDIISKDSQQIDFRMTNAQAGTFAIKSADGSTTYFSITLTAYEASASSPVITSIQGVSNGGSLYVAPNTDTELTIVGSNLTALNNGSFSIGSGQIVALTTVSATSAKVTVRSTAGDNPLRYTINGSVIFQIKLTNQSDNIGGIPIIPGDGFLD